MKAPSILISITFYICMTGLLAAGSLDTPFVRIKTIRSEIQRGENVALGCHVDGANQFFSCISKEILQQYRQDTSSEPFLLGLYKIAGAKAEIIAEAGDADPMTSDYPTTWVQEFDQLIRKTSLTEAEVDQALQNRGFLKSYSKARERMKRLTR